MIKSEYNFSKGKKILKEATQNFPSGSGIYKFLDSDKKALYVGKAKNLKKRISSYLNEIKITRRIKALISLTDKIIFIKTPSEIDSLILENNLIKELKPKFNIRLMDGKGFPFIIFERTSNWARIRKYRGKQNSKNIFFGPYSDSNAVDEVIKQLEKAFLIRSCSDNIFNSRRRPCILYQIKRCSAPCVGFINNADYNKLVDNAILFLKGKNQDVKNELIKRMNQESEKQEFESAAILRDRIKALTKISHEKYSDLNNKENFDIICCIEKYGQFCIHIFFFRSGKNLGNKEFFFDNNILDDKKTILSQFLLFFYKYNTPPKSVFLNHNIKNLNMIENLVSKYGNTKTYVKKPTKGKKITLVKMVEENIIASLKSKNSNQKESSKVLNNIFLKLKLKNFPKRIEIYDNSHLSGSNPVGGMIVYKNYNFDKNSYKKFNLEKDKKKLSDDYFMIEQVLVRRFNFNDKWKLEMPSLIIIDGGKGHLSIAKKILKKKKLSNIDIISIAKGKNRNTSNEKIFNTRGLVDINYRSKEFFFLQRLRDEAHRFAISSQKIRRAMSMKNSIFSKIEGVGKKMRMNLLTFFGSIENIKTASIEELKKAPGIGEKIATNIYKEFNKIV